MYILIELVPVAAGTGFGVFCCGLLGLALLFIMAQYAMTWLLAPVAITMTLLQSETLWWILPAVLVVGVIVNWLFATSKAVVSIYACAADVGAGGDFLGCWTDC